MDNIKDKKEKIYIGIDPDIEKSGYAVFDQAVRCIALAALPFPDVIKNLKEHKRIADESGKQLTLIVEASWKFNAHTNWHLNNIKNARTAAATGYKVGQNHETGILICQMARDMGIETEEQPPLRKIWKGKDGKITHDEMQKLLNTYGIPPIIGRTNQEMRDAALMALVYAHPINHFRKR